MDISRLSALVAQMRDEAALFRHRGLEQEAVFAESYADDWAVALKEWELEELTLEEAVEESRYSYSSLQQRVARGELRNVGKKGSPRIRRCDLPMKGGSWISHQEGGGPDIAEEILTARLSGPRK